jgi:hypothetical protein
VNDEFLNQSAIWANYIKGHHSAYVDFFQCAYLFISKLSMLFFSHLS